MWSSKRLSRRPPARPSAFLGVLLLLFTIGCGVGAESSQMENTASDAAPTGAERAAKTLLPADGEAEGWRRDGELTVYSGEELFEHINGGADIYNEYGFVTLLVQRYSRSAPNDKSVSIEIYHMGDSPGAFGIYSFNRHPTLSPADLGSGGVIHGSGVYFWQDRYYVDIHRLGGADVGADEFLALAKAIGDKIGASASKPASEPAIMKLLPDEDMVNRSAVFARGRLGINNQVYVALEDLFGLKEGESAAIARYRLGAPEFSVIIAEYKDAAACDSAFKRLRAHFLGEASEREKEFIATAMPGKHHAVREAGTRLLVVANADTQKNAITMLDRISAHVGPDIGAE